MVLNTWTPEESIEERKEREREEGVMEVEL